jgi:hypothetical protein
LARLLQTIGKVRGSGGEQSGVSPDDKTLTARVSGIDASGKRFEQVIVFDRVGCPIPKSGFRVFAGDASQAGHVTDVRELQRQLRAQGVQLQQQADESTTGPASFVAVDPDGDPSLVDQHV